MRNARLLGRIFGKQAQADAILGKLEGVDRRPAPGCGECRQGPSGPHHGRQDERLRAGSRFGVLHADFGIVPAVEGLAATNHGQAMSSEFILKTNPDWLFVIDRDAAVGRGGAAAKSMLDNELVAQTTAWKKGQVVYLDPVNWYLIGGGLTSMQASVDQIARAIGNNSLKNDMRRLVADHPRVVRFRLSKARQ